VLELLHVVDEGCGLLGLVLVGTASGLDVGDVIAGEEVFVKVVAGQEVVVELFAGDEEIGGDFADLYFRGDIASDEGAIGDGNDSGERRSSVENNGSSENGGGRDEHY